MSAADRHRWLEGVGLRAETPHERAVALALWKHTGNQTLQSWPSVEGGLSNYSGCGYSTIRRILRDFEARGWIERHVVKGGDPRQTNRYTLLPFPKKGPLPLREESVGATTPPVAITDPSRDGLPTPPVAGDEPGKEEPGKAEPGKTLGGYSVPPRPLQAAHRVRSERGTASEPPARAEAAHHRGPWESAP